MVLYNVLLVRRCYMEVDSSYWMTHRWIETDGYLLALVMCLAFYTRMAYTLRAENSRLLARAELEWADALIAGCIAQVEIKRHAMKIAVTSCVLFFGCCAFPIFNNAAERFLFTFSSTI
ncbi:hypothetical protein Ddc_11133 [Ditylenchus destructor]|nr:hypothetical protein Ddc_11133 [Ditylenchus destructor]